MLQRLSVAMIVKNEEAVIGRCLASLRAIKEISAGTYIYDTGSTDDTMRIARTAGAYVVAGDWPNDFAEARNRSLAMCPTPWVLVVDADEQVMADVGELAKLLDDFDAAGTIGGHLAQVNFDGDGNEADTALQTRLFRRDLASYRGIVHEIIAPVDGSDISNQAHAVPRQVVHLLHDGYADPALLKRKIRRNADVIAAHLGPDADVQDPLVLKALVDEARSLNDLGERGAAYWDLFRVHTSTLRTPYRLFGLEVLAGMLINDGQWGDAAAVIAEYEQCGGSPSFLSWMSGVLALRKGDLEEARRQFAGLSYVASIVGAISPPANLWEARLQVALSQGYDEEALSCQLTIILGCHVSVGQVARLCYLWGSRPLDPLLDIIAEGGPGMLAGLVEDLDAQARAGAAVAEPFAEALRTRALQPCPGR